MSQLPDREFGKALLDFFLSLQSPDPGELIIKGHEAAIAADAIWNNGEDFTKLERQWPVIKDSANFATTEHHKKIAALSDPFFSAVARKLMDTPL
jgi:hypothetical protein